MSKLTNLNNLDKLAKALDARYKELIDKEKARAIAEEQVLQSEIDITKEMFGGKSIKYIAQAEYDALTEEERNSDTVTYFITDAVDLSHDHENKEFLDGLSQEVLDAEFIKAVDFDGGEDIVIGDMEGGNNESNFATKDYVDNKVDEMEIELSESVIRTITIPGINRFNIENYIPKTFADPRDNTLVYRDNDNYYSIIIEVNPNTKYKYAALNSAKDAYLEYDYGFISYLDKDKNLLSYETSGYKGIINTPDDCYFVVHSMYSNFTKEILDDRKPMFVEDYMFEKFEDMIDLYIPYVPYQLDPTLFNTNFFKETKLVVQNALNNKKSQWQDKIGLTYGDSITAINNPDCSNGGHNGNEEYRSWGYYIIDELGLSKLYGRGIGGQTYAWGTKGGSVAFINSDGSYNSRNDESNYDDYTGDIPEETIKVRGTLSSWLRITTQIPESIKDEIDFIFIMGGTNDITNNIDIGESNFIVDNSTDLEWYESEYYNGGDFDLNTYIGGLCSTIMKIQTWCPNAIIIVGTPLSGRSKDSTTGNNQHDFFINTLGLKYIDYVEKTIKVAREYSIPCIDVYGTTGINPFNRKKYIHDLVHPFTDSGTKALARAIIGGMMCIIPNIK